MDEIWKDIPGYETYYQVSTFGRVRSLDRQRWTGNGYHLKKGQILKQSLTTTGYQRVNLSVDANRKVWKVHQLVAITFLKHQPEGLKKVVDHIDNNPLNNKLENLQIISNRLNTSKNRKGKSKYTGVFLKKEGLWVASAVYKGKLKHLGYFRIEEAASKAYQDFISSI